MLLTDNSLGLLDGLLSLGEDELDVAGVRHVGVDLFRLVSQSLSVTSSTWDHIRGREHGTSGGAAWGPG